LFVEHGLADTPDGVTLKCTRRLEALAFQPHFDAVEELDRISLLHLSIEVT